MNDTTLMLRGQARIVLRYSLISASALLVYGTSIAWADTSLISASALLLVLRHSVMWVGTYSTSVLSDQCFGTPASATALLLHRQTRL